MRQKHIYKEFPALRKIFLKETCSDINKILSKRKTKKKGQKGRKIHLMSIFVIFIKFNGKVKVRTNVIQTMKRKRIGQCPK